MSQPPPIDAVITWVDGSDEKHFKKLTQYLETLPFDERPAFHKTRFSDMGEIVFCVESILHFAPWIRTIYIVADDQQPSFINDIKGTRLENRIVMVDHTVIFRDYEDCLPTFNTRSIVSMLWRIPNLSEQFIYFNDDYILSTLVRPDDFFIDGKAILRGQWKFSLFKGIKERARKFFNSSTKPVRANHTTSQWLGAKYAGFKFRFLMVPHNPHAFLKTTLKAFHERHPNKIRKQISYKLRSVDQFNVDSFSAHLNLKHNKAIVSNNIKTTIIKAESMAALPIEKSLKASFQSERRSFLCIQSLDNATTETQRIIIDRLATFLPPIIRNHMKLRGKEI